MECFCDACFRGDTDQCEVPSWAVRMRDQGWACYPPGSLVPALVKAAVELGKNAHHSSYAKLKPFDIALKNAAVAVAEQLIAEQTKSGK